ncbi:acetylserotonin O-methyltransferase isoform X1 [Nannospalax galili]|uniref:acetylserotonin O-methyltransferase isoform X1 n=1 Tax=Nannospalax galili TaxID=1026970 RepID=UPI00111BF4D7|nr:acetylserotonin O-methyltransferase isoform X1 [Nannospalax galili]XP_029411978.1 acetylserotonin O-methyltransferase isoform X1 [Nannospalax galili]
MMSRYMTGALFPRQGRNQYPEALGVPSHEPFAAIYRSEAERLRFMRGLQDMWRVCGRRVMAAFDLSPFRVICDVGGEPPPVTAVHLVPSTAVRLDPSTAVHLVLSTTVHLVSALLSGGSGALAKDCAALYPGSRVTVFDVPEVVSAAKTHFRFHREGRIEFCAGASALWVLGTEYPSRALQALVGAGAQLVLAPAPVAWTVRTVLTGVLGAQGTSSRTTSRRPSSTYWPGSYTTGRTGTVRGSSRGSTRPAPQVGGGDHLATSTHTHMGNMNDLATSTQTREKCTT